VATLDHRPDQEAKRRDLGLASNSAATLLPLFKLLAGVMRVESSFDEPLADAVFMLVLLVLCYIFDQLNAMS
jgi:hypothetical protein